MENTPFIKILANHLSAPTTTAKDKEDPLLVNYKGHVCTMTFNRPKNFNSLNIEMVRILNAERLKWNSSSSTRAVIFKGAGGKAFSSGGDMIRLISSMFSPETSDYPEIFFREEYTLILDLAQMKTTQIVFWDGITMGGGAGLSVHAQIKIATEHAVFAMPETRVGLFTDASGGYFLPKLRNNLGIFMGLTATHLKGKEIVQVGLADFYVRREHLEKLERDLVENTKENSTLEELRDIVRKYTEPVERKYPNEELINEIFGGNTVEEIYNALKESKVNREFTQKLVKTIDTLSPLCLKISFEQMRRGRKLSLRENLRMDMRLMMRTIEASECYEGARAALIEKGAKPSWLFENIFVTPKDVVDKFFEELESHREILKSA